MDGKVSGKAKEKDFKKKKTAKRCAFQIKRHEEYKTSK